ncbi:helix-turn-helix domain-containing protein [Desulfitobacterium hafniense]|uniref:helix-turn-helix domain-containing protein n=1 Tax=Desulfitobacterium hafniense TaxID=49338 RepID=UPI000369B7D1|nr:helix-turn-helix domain-containing protein [Desulfitobacterium hafniense]
MKSTIEDFFATDTYAVEHGDDIRLMVHLSRAPEFASQAVVEDADGKQTLIDVSYRSWEDFDDLLGVIVEEYETPSPLDDVFSATEAAALWGLDESTVKKACLQGRFHHYEAKKSGWPWLVTRQGMERLYGAKHSE